MAIQVIPVETILGNETMVSCPYDAVVLLMWADRKRARELRRLSPFLVRLG